MDSIYYTGPITYILLVLRVGENWNTSKKSRVVTAMTPTWTTKYYIKFDWLEMFLILEPVKFRVTPGISRYDVVMKISSKRWVIMSNVFVIAVEILHGQIL